jgi:hypothetical protein
MSHYRIKYERGTTLTQVADTATLTQAEAWIADREKTDPVGVASGCYTVDGPCPDPGETIQNEGGDWLLGGQEGQVFILDPSEVNCT